MIPSTGNQIITELCCSRAQLGVTRLESCAIVLVQHLLGTSRCIVVKMTVWIQSFLYFFIIIASSYVHDCNVNLSMII